MACLSCRYFLARVSSTLHALEIRQKVKRPSLRKILFHISFKDNDYRNCGKGLGIQNGERLQRGRYAIKIVVLGQMGTISILGPSVRSKGCSVKCQ